MPCTCYGDRRHVAGRAEAALAPTLTTDPDPNPDPGPDLALQAVQKQRGVVDPAAQPPPSSFTVMDLRILVRRMQAGGVDWSIIRFVGTDRAFEVVKEGRRQEGQRQGQQADEPPPLEPDH